MDKDYLLKRREYELAEHKILERVQGSGWHPADPTVRERGGTRLTERPMALHHDTDVYFVGPDVAVVREGLAKFVAAYDAQRQREADAAKASDTEAPVPPPQERHAYRVAKKQAAKTDDVMEVTTQEYNAILYALNTDVVFSGAVGPTEPPK